MTNTKEIPLHLATELIDQVSICVGDIHGQDLMALLDEVSHLASKIREKIARGAALDARIFEQEEPNESVRHIH